MSVGKIVEPVRGVEGKGELVEIVHPAGLLRFENFDVGEWLTKKGFPAKKAVRRYTLDDVELTSVSSIVGLLEKPALYYWYEDHGARGAVRAERAGMLEGVPDKEIVRKVRDLKLGADVVRDEAADRGKAVHTVFHVLAETGDPPNLADYPDEWHPWMQGAVRAWLQLGVEPDEVIGAEFLVANPRQGYAGRPDLYFRHPRRGRVLIDYKTGRGRIFEQAHFQTRGYAEAMPHSELEPPDLIVVVGIGDDGSHRFVRSAASRREWASLVAMHRARRRIAPRLQTTVEL